MVAYIPTCLATLLLLAGATAHAQLSLRATGGGGNAVKLQAPSTVASDITFLLPATDGSANQCLATNGSRQLTWRTVNGSGYSLDADDGSPTNALYVNSVGNVGVGTTSSSRKLGIVGPGENSTPADGGAKGASVLISSTDGGAGSGGSIEFGAGFGSYTQPYFAAIKALITNGSSNTAGDLAIYTRNASTDSALTERLRVLGNGNVGIGLSAPSAKLHVVGTFNITDGTQGSGKVLTSDGSGNASWQTATDTSTTKKYTKYSSAPFTCNATNDASVAMTNAYTLCTCVNGTGWVDSTTGNACNWTGNSISVAVATFGGNCGSATGNWTSWVSGQCNGLSTCSFTPATAGDPNYGCGKTFTAQYRCGLVTKSVSVPVEAGGVTTTFTCP